MNQQTNKIKDDLIATLRAMVADEELQIEFSENLSNDFFGWNQNLKINQTKILLPEVVSNEVEKTYRAASDMALAYLLFHDVELHQSFDIKNQDLFDEFEKVRVVINIADLYLGSGMNLLKKIEADLIQVKGRDMMISYRNFHSEFLSFLLLDDFITEKNLPQTKKLIEDLKNNFSEKIINEVGNLRKITHNQKAFALAIEALLDMLQKEQEKNNLEKKSDQKNENDEVNFNQENIEQESDDYTTEGLEEVAVEKKNKKIQESKEEKMAGKIKQRLERQNISTDKIEYKNPYKIYSDRFDEVIFPQKLIAKVELENLRNQLDLKISKLSGVSRKMSLKLKRKLLSKKNSLIEYNSSRGILDKKKLTRLVIDPMLEDIWVNNKSHEYNDVALTILLDNSGSMRGNPIIMSAMACEIIAEILEKFLVKTEIIGFTTADWKGGRVRKLWESSGRPENPGRLNELRHIIYKSFNQNFKKSKTNLGLMLKDGILKENIDGEALLFARSRLMQQDQKRKILMVISDGTPIDDSTSIANDDKFLTNHLVQVINNIEKKSKIEIVGIGIGHATDDFYKNSITVKSLNDLGDAMIEKLVNLL